MSATYVVPQSNICVYLMKSSKWSKKTLFQKEVAVVVDEEEVVEVEEAPVVEAEVAEGIGEVVEEAEGDFELFLTPYHACMSYNLLITIKKSH